MSFGQFNQNSEEPMADMNVTPLVDVMLVLLIVFMITMPIITSTIPLELPKTAKKEQVEPPNIIRLAIDATGNYFISDELFSLEQLTDSFKQKLDEDPNVVLSISADKNAAYEHVAQVLNQAKESGLVKIGFVTEALLNSSKTKNNGDATGELNKAETN